MTLLGHSSDGRSQAIDRRVKRTIDFLEVDVSRGTRVPELAARVGLSASRLEHLFKVHARMSIREYVQSVRLARAAELIVRTDERISQICYAVGFRDPSNFNHAFKRSYGLSPMQYRRSVCDAADSTNE
jgi:transcriptional regulator GlxA family with amidase domain